MQLVSKTKRVVEAHLNNSSVRAVSGSMVAFEGQVTFKSAGFGGGDGLVAGIKKKATGEGLSLMECSGSGIVYLAQDAANVTVVDLAGETLQVEAQQLLALTSNLQTNVTFAGVRGGVSGQGLFTTTVTGHGQVALLSQGGPLIHLEVSPQSPLVVDPDAFVCARGALSQSFITDVSWRTVVGQGSGEAFSLRWDGTGVVSIQPAER
ncbi:AIM24 family protein [Gordonia sp. (in: high G+C Gram-positive bacteria)]|uniref:AIM24 family protein n=1 Tax=Gordonia sp. (in: high G+C Gram-positive bacteria) TaxID=84139 RepID=UPI00169FF426|nr:AIM24 family protein [Gordonia sp. (in: high G+C Gram-positive bacteria)]NLG47148.1 AIM24 family protein [Gordonia sp. (in: high G+C Gram-positive bacteria)]